jgi:hypothetical protein
MTRPRAVAAAILAGAALAACDSHTGDDRIPRAQPSSVSPEEPPAVSTAPTAALSVGTAPSDLHDVDWANISLPGEFCDVPGLITFSNGEATGSSQRWGSVHLFVDKHVVYGDVEGDSRSEAAVLTGCDNGGGTAGGQLGFAYVVLSGRGGSLDVIGSVTPKVEPPDVHTTLIGEITLARGQLTVHEAWYRPSDPTCCPSGTAVTVWKLEAGRLVPGAPSIRS